MQERKKKMISIAIIILLLPYVLTVFIKGDGTFAVVSMQVDADINVKVAGKEKEVMWQEFLVGVLAKEVPCDFDIEAMKAQAVITRTRLLSEQNNNEKYVFDEVYYTMDQISEKWKSNDVVKVYSDLTRAVEETENEVLKYNDEFAKTPYHLLNNGKTRDGNEVFLSTEYPYLASVECQLDIENEKEINTKTVTYKELEKALELEKQEEWCYEDIEIVTKDKAGYVVDVNVKGNTINGEVFRRALLLKSSVFSFQEDGDKLKITTQGIGHGVGMSQNTAHHMALEGKTYEEILLHFYSGTEIKTINK